MTYLEFLELTKKVTNELEKFDVHKLVNTTFLEIRNLNDEAERRIKIIENFDPFEGLTNKTKQPE